MKESDLYYPIKDYYESVGYEVFSEVTAVNTLKRADIVLIKNNIRICIELKRTLSFELLEQAKYWKKYSNLIYIGVPVVNKKRTPIIREILKIYGIGLIEIDLEEYKKDKIGLSIETGIFRQMSGEERDNIRLVEEHKTWLDGGSKSGNYVTDYKLLMQDVYELLRSDTNDINGGWYSLEEISQYIQSNSRESVKKHYTNPKKSIYQSLTNFESGDIMSMIYKGKKHFKVMEESTKYLKE